MGIIEHREQCSDTNPDVYKRGCKLLKKDWKAGVHAQISAIKQLEQQLFTEDPSAAADAGITQTATKPQKQERDLCANADASDLADCQAREQAYKDLVAACKADRSI